MKCLMMVPVAACALFATNVQAQGDLDGRWSVLVVTESGQCDRAYRYGVRVENGKIQYSGDSELIAVDFSGQVDRAGRVKVRISSGGQVAVGTGRLAGRSGGGTWTGNSATTKCSGRWEAERRS
jgi:hypothetical protein